MSVPEVQALLLIHIQRAFVEVGSPVPGARRLLSAVHEQLARARAAGAVVIHLQNDGDDGAPDAPGSWGWELAVAPAGDESVLRTIDDNGFAGTGLSDLLDDRAVSSISVCGLMSEMCVAATTRSALELGYEVVLAHDSHATYDVPAFAPGESGVPAELAARAAEWSLGDLVTIVPSGAELGFTTPPT